jgi:protein SCO1/2
MPSLAGMRRTLAVVTIVAGVAALVGCGGSGSDPSSTTQASASAHYAGASANPPKPVPPLKLTDSLGQPVNIDDYRGKAVLVTFIYDHCPDTCPTIVANLHAAQNELGPQAKDMQIIAVSVDPKGDTPTTVKRFLAEHQMTGRMKYLLGSRKELESVWSDWNIVSKSNPTRKDPDAVEHSALVYGISGSGKITTLYPSNFKPRQIAHDVPILASS